MKLKLKNGSSKKRKIQLEIESFVAAESIFVQTSLRFGNGTEITGRFARFI